MEQVHVRMILWDYDAAPDGYGTYKVLDKEFPSLEEALEYRRRYFGLVYWGTVETLDGQLLVDFDGGEDPYDRNYGEL